MILGRVIVKIELRCFKIKIMELKVIVVGMYIIKWFFEEIKDEVLFCLNKLVIKFFICWFKEKIWGKNVYWVFRVICYVVYLLLNFSWISKMYLIVFDFFWVKVLL